MARPKKFDEAAVLNTMMIQFWQRGFTATSIKDIENSTHMTASSLYNHFGNKETLFAKVLDHYFEQIIKNRINIYLNRKGDPLTNLQEFVSSAVDQSVPRDLQGHACLLVNTITEWGPNLSELKLAFKRYDKEISKALENNIAEAQDLNQIRRDKSTQELATYLKINLNGLLVESKVNSSHRVY